MVCADLLHAYTAANKTDPPEHGEEIWNQVLHHLGRMEEREEEREIMHRNGLGSMGGTGKDK